MPLKPESIPGTAITLTDTPTPPDALLARLQSHLPYSLPVLRRLQFARNFPGGSTPHTHVLYATTITTSTPHLADKQENGEVDEKRPFAAAYVDLSREPETEVWLYSTAEDGVDGGAGEVAAQEGAEESTELVLALLRRIRAIAEAGDYVDLSSGKQGGNGGDEGKGNGKTRVLIGTLHEAVRQGLLARGVTMETSPSIPAEVGWEFCGKWLFRVEDFPPGCGGALPDGMRWDKVRREDAGLVLSRTSIKRQEATLLMLPSTVIRLENGTAIAWAFMGLDGTIMTLHVEEPYRRLGLAKAVGCRLMRGHLHEYGDDGWGAADVFVENSKSQAFCRSIGGKLSWTLSWATVHLSSVGDPM